MRQYSSGRSLKLGLNRRLKQLKSKCSRIQLDLIRLERSDLSSYVDDRKEFGAHFQNVSEDEEECVGQVDQTEFIKQGSNVTLSEEYLDFANIDGLKKKIRPRQDNRSYTVSQLGSLADASDDETTSQSGTLADVSDDETISQSGTLADVSDDETVSQSGTLADASDDETTSQWGSLADAADDETTSQSRSLADASDDATISQSGTLADASDDETISKSGTLSDASEDDQTVSEIQDEVHLQEQIKKDNKKSVEKTDGLTTSKLDKKTKTRHRCDICRRTCSSFGNLKRHMYIHNEDKPFSCSICQRGFIRRKRLKEHVNSFHKGQKPYSCNICNKAFSLKHNLKAHMNYHLSISQYTCCLCNKHFKYRGDLSKHIKRVHNEPLGFGKNCQILDQDDRITLKSPQHGSDAEDSEAQPSDHSTEDYTEIEGYEQNNTSNQNSNRTKETDRHYMDEKFQHDQDAVRMHATSTKLSGNDFRRKYKHKGTNANKAGRCGVCHETFSSPYNLKRHMYLHNTISRYTCTMCSKGFARKDALNLHISSAHLKQKAYECDSCSKTFATRQNLEEHRLRHSSVRKFPCSTCGKRSKTKSDLIKHIKRKHPEETKAHGKSERVSTNEDQTAHTGNYEDEEDLKRESDELHQCKTCDKVFTVYSNLKRHLLTHSLIKPFVCSVCGQGFTRKEGLQVHIYSVHTGYRPYICNVCPKTFTTKQHLNNHALCHSVERTFLCVHCNKGFKTKSNLCKHVKRIHSSDKKLTGVMDEKRKYVCMECNRRYTCKGDLKMHTKRSHANNDRYICVVCKKDYKELKCFEQHEERHRMDTDNVYECTDCMTEFIHYDAMKNHVANCSFQS